MHGRALAASDPFPRLIVAEYLDGPLPDGLSTADLVSVYPLLPCGECVACTRDEHCDAGEICNGSVCTPAGG